MSYIHTLVPAQLCEGFCDTRPIPTAPLHKAQNPGCAGKASVGEECVTACSRVQAQRLSDWEAGLGLQMCLQVAERKSFLKIL